jgi:hypothetical protein
MMKLATNSEFRASIARVKEEMEKAGLDLMSPVRYGARPLVALNLIVHILGCRKSCKKL